MFVLFVFFCMFFFLILFVGLFCLFASFVVSELPHLDPTLHLQADKVLDKGDNISEVSKTSRGRSKNNDGIGGVETCHSIAIYSYNV